jgi:hypothetical protein
MATRVTVTKDSVSAVVGALNWLTGRQVLIGIPEAKTERDDGEPGQPVTNAALLYIHEHGSPAANIPARPTLVPGVEKAEEDALVPLRAAAEAALATDRKKAERFLNQAGVIGMNSARAEINSNVPPPLSPATIRSRKYSRGTKSMRQSEKRYLEMISSGAQAAGMSLGEIQDAAGIVSLVNTAQMRNAVTYVVRDRK